MKKPAECWTCLASSRREDWAWSGPQQQRSKTALQLGYQATWHGFLSPQDWCPHWYGTQACHLVCQGPNALLPSISCPFHPWAQRLLFVLRTIQNSCRPVALGRGHHSHSLCLASWRSINTTRVHPQLDDLTLSRQRSWKDLPSCELSALTFVGHSLWCPLVHFSGRVLRSLASPLPPCSSWLIYKLSSHLWSVWRSSLSRSERAKKCTEEIEKTGLASAIRTIQLTLAHPFA